MTTNEAFTKFVAENPHLVNEETDLLCLRAAFLAGASHGVEMSREMVLGKIGNETASFREFLARARMQTP